MKGWIYEAAEFLSVQEYTHVLRWADAILERPAVGRGRMVNRDHRRTVRPVARAARRGGFQEPDSGQTVCRTSSIMRKGSGAPESRGSHRFSSFGKKVLP